MILRMFNVYGELQDIGSINASVILKFFHTLVSGRPMTIYGTGARDFLHVNDAVQTFLEAGIRYREVESTRVFNIASGQSVSLLELATLMANVSEQKRSVVMVAARIGEVIHSHASIDRAKQLLHFSPQISLAAGLAQVWKSISSQTSDSHVPTAMRPQSQLITA